MSNNKIDVEGKTSNQVSQFDWSTSFKMIEYAMMLFMICYITGRIIKGIPPSDEIRGVSTEVPKALWIFAIFSYIIIAVVKVISNRNVLMMDEKREYTQGGQIFNILLYFTIILLSYTFCVSYLCMKVRRKPIQFGGMFEWMEKGTGDTEVDPSIQMIITLGILLVIINSLTNLFLYLKNVDESRKDSVARSIYQAQLCVLLIMILTIIFLSFLSTGKKFVDWETAGGLEILNTGPIEALKILLFVVLIVVGAVMVNNGAETKSFFGLSDERKSK
jgi:H+/Cl- antiporter ClcA